MGEVEFVENHNVWELPSGTTIHCSNPKCGEYIGRLTMDIKKGTPVTDDCIEGPGVRKNMLPRCTTCGYYWYLKQDTASKITFTRLHTGRGWFPPDDRLANFE